VSGKVLVGEKENVTKGGGRRRENDIPSLLAKQSALGGGEQNVWVQGI